MKNLFEELHEENMVMLLHTLSEKNKARKTEMEPDRLQSYFLSSVGGE